MMPYWLNSSARSFAVKCYQNFSPPIIYIIKIKYYVKSEWISYNSKYTQHIIPL